MLVRARTLVQRAREHHPGARADRPVGGLPRAGDPPRGVLHMGVARVAQRLPGGVVHQRVGPRPGGQEALGRAAEDDAVEPQAPGRAVIGDQHSVPGTPLADGGGIQVHPQGLLEGAEREGAAHRVDRPEPVDLPSTSSIPAARGSR